MGGEPGEEPTAIFQKGRGNGSSKGNMPKIIGPDTRANNGVLHIVDNVILQKDTLPTPPPAECARTKDCGSCKGECQANDGCRFSKIGWCKRDCEERFGWDNGAICEGGDDDGEAKVCFGGFDCASCQKEMTENEGCGREPTEEGLVYCEEKWGACQCTGGTSCGSCKGECQNNEGCPSLKLYIANETVQNGLVLTQSVKVEMMMVEQKFALAVKVVVHASVSARITKGVVGNLQESARAIAKRSTVLAKLFLLSFIELTSG